MSRRAPLPHFFNFTKFEILFVQIALFSVVSCAAFFNFTVLHTNDVHARYDEINIFGSRCPEGSKACFGGVARMMTKVRDIRNSFKNVLFLNAGDYYQGSLYYSIHKWNITANFMNKLRYDAMAIGNHEFDDGIDGLIPFLNVAEFPVLACNIDTSKEHRYMKILSSVVLMSGGHKIGIIGYTTQETPTIAIVGNLAFTDEISCIKKEVKKMEADGINKIIALGHSGFKIDKEIAEKVHGIDIVIGGHTNTFTYTGPPPSIEDPVAPYPLVITQYDGSQVLVLEDFAFGKYLGFLSVVFDDNGRVDRWFGNPILLDHTVQKDRDMVNALAPYMKVVKERGQQVVGQTLVDLIGDRAVCRMRECNLGNILADASVWFYRGKPSKETWSALAVAVWNAGGIRSSVITENGTVNITMEDILTFAPFGNTIDVVEIYGRDVRRMMEHSVSDYDPNGLEASGGFLQVSGIQVKYDITRAVGERIVKLLVKCSECKVPSYQPVNDSHVYRVAMPTFLYEGGNGYGFLRKNAVHIQNRDGLDTDIIIKYLQKMSPVTPAVEGRITFASDEHNSATLPNVCSDVLIFVFSSLPVISALLLT